MKAIGIIPARLDSKRYPNKPMALIHGMPMVGHCYQRTNLAEGIEETYVATCDIEIAKYVNSIGGSAIMTSSKHTRATTRTAEAIEHIETNKEFGIGSENVFGFHGKHLRKYFKDRFNKKKLLNDLK